MSDLTEAASEAMGIPTALVERSAAARAAASDTELDQILSAWAGGEAPPRPAPEPEPRPDVETGEPEAVAEPAEPTETEPEPVAAAVAVAQAPEPASMPEPELGARQEPEVELEPVSLGVRLRTSVRIGAWTGAGLGLLGFFMASSAWAPNAAALEDAGGPIVQVDATGVLIGSALVSIAFGAVVASLARAGAAWSNPAMQLSSSRSSTAWIGAAIGLVLGLIAGALLTGGFGTELEGGEGLVQLPVLPTFGVMVIGGFVLGAITAAIPQLLGTPVTVGKESEEEVEVVRDRLGGAMSIPLAATLLLVLLVIPIGYLFIQSNHLGSNGAAIVAILTAGGILGFAALAGGKPQMRISFGELMVAVAGIGVVLIVILAVLFYTGQDEEHDSGGEEAAVTQLL